ncbi:hypothetical protein C8J57DRAFT_1525189 [Mycena rebaudengoi]|nr:hypothetical protein C8J57DRAFT_1525189 [Mycena rebaudengoi]
MELVKAKRLRYKEARSSKKRTVDRDDISEEEEARQRGPIVFGNTNDGADISIQIGELHKRLDTPMLGSLSTANDRMKRGSAHRITRERTSTRYIVPGSASACGLGQGILRKGWVRPAEGPDRRVNREVAQQLQADKEIRVGTTVMTNPTIEGTHLRSIRGCPGGERIRDLNLLQEVPTVLLDLRDLQDLQEEAEVAEAMAAEMGQYGTHSSRLAHLIGALCLQ